MTIKEMKVKRAELVRQNQKEYATRGNTQRCQELFAEIQKIDRQISERSMK